ncbi:hypothetical protein BKA69DRAFT_1041336 [Paraphysoderma sedebokerense]|nr:hypothetical protein BKA69DRAFT_1041336 [Paraphysoderma sedebokerense]
MALSIPLILMGILFATILLYFMFSLVIRLLQKKGWISSNDTNRTHTDMPKDSEFRGKRHISRTFIIIFNSSLSLVYNTVASYSLALFDCTQEGDGFYYLDSDPSLRCYEDWWYADLKFAISGIVCNFSTVTEHVLPSKSFYVLGIPVYFGVILYFSRREASPGSFWGSFQNYCNVIATSDTSYKSNRTGFMLLQFFHKLMLISISMFFTRLMITFIMTLKYQPYVHDSLNYLEVHSIGSNIVLLTSGLLFYNDQLTPALKAIAIDAVIVVILGFILAAIFAAGYEVKLGFSRRMAKYKSVDNLSQKAPKESILLVQKSSEYLSRFRNNSRQRK